MSFRIPIFLYTFQKKASFLSTKLEQKRKKAIHPSLHDFPKKSAFDTTISRGRGIMEREEERKNAVEMRGSVRQ
jgi:hypothetical protein